ncbi:TIGR04211 family SH3 domain-containing protein [Desulfobotulus sp.]|jgi:SH3 domain protein|uniref:TIGR04211 family SH3 domain-containing protein n=1 Tax=Desulfobotulus sp. TaxID=1940337 RepID=UPI002A35EEE6|nr:TIGR04211 family SH3 domain-containing protein [Desulfobotulus sp.]MDY0163729.1 TIGR04211 family SH3 domain-containing protein [Desulfobotulus sp.]
MRSFLFFCLSGLLFFASSGMAQARQAYVTDNFQISIRRGPTTEHRILRFISSGQAVEVLEETDGWSHIRTIEPADRQITGWVLTRYLIHRLPHEYQSLLLTEQNEKLQKQSLEDQKARKLAEEELNRLQNLLSETQTQLENTQRSLDQLTEDASDYLTLRQNCTEQEKEHEKLLSENIILRKQTRHQSLLIGGGLVLAGLFLGFMWGRREKNRYSGRLI